MADREKVIKVYEDFVNGYECFCTSDDYEYEMHKAVLSLLKEQQNEKWEYQELNEYLQDKLKKQEEKLATMRMIYGTDAKVTGELVRCKDCLYRGNEKRCLLASTAMARNYPLPISFLDNRGEWFCADGRKKDD